mgnify:FL=1
MSKKLKKPAPRKTGTVAKKTVRKTAHAKKKTSEKKTSEPG